MQGEILEYLAEKLGFKLKKNQTLSWKKCGTVHFCKFDGILEPGYGKRSRKGLRLAIDLDTPFSTNEILFVEGGCGTAEDFHKFQEEKRLKEELCEKKDLDHREKYKYFRVPTNIEKDKLLKYIIIKCCNEHYSCSDAEIIEVGNRWELRVGYEEPDPDFDTDTPPEEYNGYRFSYLLNPEKLSNFPSLLADNEFFVYRHAWSVDGIDSDISQEGKRTGSWFCFLEEGKTLLASREDIFNRIRKFRKLEFVRNNRDKYHVVCMNAEDEKLSPFISISDSAENVTTRLIDRVGDLNVSRSHLVFFNEDAKNRDDLSLFVKKELSINDEVCSIQVRLHDFGDNLALVFTPKGTVHTKRFDNYCLLPVLEANLEKLLETSNYGAIMVAERCRSADSMCNITKYHPSKNETLQGIIDQIVDMCHKICDFEFSNFECIVIGFGEKSRRSFWDKDEVTRFFEPLILCYEDRKTFLNENCVSRLEFCKCFSDSFCYGPTLDEEKFVKAFRDLYPSDDGISEEHLIEEIRYWMRKLEKSVISNGVEFNVVFKGWWKLFEKLQIEKKIEELLEKNEEYVDRIFFKMKKDISQDETVSRAVRKFGKIKDTIDQIKNNELEIYFLREKLSKLKEEMYSYYRDRM